MDPSSPVPKQRNLIFDVGLHKGEDTDFYLKKGFEVVAFEANPGLVAHCKRRFATELASGRLTIVEGAIMDPTQLAPGQSTVRFYFDETSSTSGSIKNDWIGGADKSPPTLIEMEVGVVDFGEMLKKHGVPYYLKIDIEGADMACLKALEKISQLPDYLSLETSRESYQAACDELGILQALGYTSFQAIEQSGIKEAQSPPNPAREGVYVDHRFEYGASGVFGRELSGTWKTPSSMKRLLYVISIAHHLLGNNGTLYKWQFRGASRLRRAVRWSLGCITRANVPGWYDTHARHRDAES